MTKANTRSNESKAVKAGNYNRQTSTDIDKLAERWVELLFEEILKNDILLVENPKKIFKNPDY